MFLKRVEKKKNLGRHNKEISLNTCGKQLFNFFVKNAEAATRGVL